MSERMQVITYTALADVTPPRQGQVLRFDGLGMDGRLYRVMNEPEPDDEGTFTVEIQPVN